MFSGRFFCVNALEIMILKVEVGVHVEVLREKLMRDMLMEGLLRLDSLVPL